MTQARDVRARREEEKMIQQVKFDPVTGLVPVIVQDTSTNEVLMLGYMNQEALDRTVESGLVTFWSRSHRCLWTKGETSGNFLHLWKILIDCDRDAILVIAVPDGPTCHEGMTSCFRPLEE